MANRTLTVLAIPAFAMVCALALAQGAPPPPGWGKPKPLPPANGEGQVTFKHAGTPFTLPLNKIEIDTSVKDMFMVSLVYVDAAQANKLSLAFTSMPKLGKNDPLMITGFIVETKAHGLSRHAANRGKCSLSVTTLAAQDVSGSLSCTGLTDMSATAATPDVTDVRFEGRLKAK